MEISPLVMTLVLVRNKDKVLLGMKKTNLGVGRWNGYGGKVEEGEDIEASARRELEEESGLTARSLIKKGVCTFISPVRTPIEMHIFETCEFEGTPRETPEMGAPQWFSCDALPTDLMWKSDLLWWPYYMRGVPFEARLVFDAEDTVLTHEIRLLD